MGVNLSGSVPRDPSSRGLLGSLDREASGTIGRGFGNGFLGLVGGIANAFRRPPEPDSPFAAIGEVGEEIRDGQKDLNDRVELISVLLDYGATHMPAGRELMGAQKLPFTEQVGPMKNCEMFNGGIKFLDVGVWNIYAQISVSWIKILTGDVYWRVVVYKPDGTSFSQKKGAFSSGGVQSSEIVTAVVADEPGYYVLVYVDYIAGTRGILGGSAWTQLIVQHMSQTVEGAWGDGSGPSDMVSVEPETDPDNSPPPAPSE